MKRASLHVTFFMGEYSLVTSIRRCEKWLRHHLFIAPVILAVTSLIDYLYFKKLFGNADLVVLFWTALIMLWTAWETLGLKTLQRETLNLEHRPYLQLHLSGSEDAVLCVTNIGRGIATAIHIENFMIRKGDATSSIGFNGLEALGPGQSASFIMQNDRDPSSTRQELRDSIKNNTLDNIQVSYYDLTDWIYEARFRPRDDYVGGFSILGSQKRTRRITKHEE